MRFSRQEYWSGLPFPSPEDLPDPGIKPRFPALQADSLLSEPLGYKYNDRMSNFTAITSIDRVQTWVNLPNVSNACGHSPNHHFCFLCGQD